MTSHVQPGEPDRLKERIVPQVAGDAPTGDVSPLAPCAAGDSRSESPTMPPAVPKRGRGRWILAGAALALLAAGVALAAWRFWPSPAPEPPPVPADIVEPEVREVIQTARRHVLNEPRSGGAWGLLGMVLLTQLFDHDADGCFAEAARLDPHDARWPYARGLIALKRDPDHALDYLRQAARIRSPAEDQSRYRLQLAEALLERRQLDEAEALFRVEPGRGPDDARAAYGLGLIAVARGDAQAAQPYLAAARASPYARKKAAAQLAALARGRGDDAAAAAAEKEWADLPDDPPWPDPVLDRILDLQVGHRRREREVGQLEQDHRYQEAADIYLQEIDKDPNAAAAYTGAGLDLARLRQYDRAFPLLREGAKRNPDGVDAHFTLALALFTRAEKEWAQTPGDPRLKELFEEAAEHAQRATVLKPNHAQAYLFWGLSLKYLGKSAEAVEPLRKGVECRPEQIELQLALGEVLMDTGRSGEAATYLENARRLDPTDPRPAHDLEEITKKKP